MPDDPATQPADPAGAAARRQEVVVAGHRGDRPRARRGLGDSDPSVRAAALGALGRLADLGVGDLLAGLADPSPDVRRRAAQEAAASDGAPDDRSLDDALIRATSDPDPLVADAACWALGEREVVGAVGALVAATTHPDIRCRETAVAALGAIGDPSGLPAVLAALADKPTVRRRAVVALAAFDGPEVDEALRQGLDDRDWQVRQAASILLDEDLPEGR